MMKKFGLVVLWLLATPSFASDNRNAPNVFSSGSTISSSKMNENFNFLASEIRAKDVYCDNGETIMDAINEGYNSLTIRGNCNGAIAVYKLSPSAYGFSYNDMPNKPISYLDIKGFNNDKSDTITTPSGGFDFFVDDIDEVDDMIKTNSILEIIVDWCKDDNGKNILYKSSGEERYPDFKLYKMIARTVHKHTPEAQLEREIFKDYIVEHGEIDGLGKKCIVMDLDSIIEKYKNVQN